MVGCATHQVSLSKQTQQNIETAENILFIPQNNIEVKVYETDASKHGLLGMMIAAGIDSVRRSSAEEEAAPMIQQLQNYDFRSVMLEVLSAEISKMTKIKFEIPIRLETIDSESQKRISFEQSNASAVLFTTVNYRLESGKLIIKSNVEMYPKSKILLQFRKKPDNSNPINTGNIIYRKPFTFTKQAVTASNIRASLKEGAISIAKQIVADLNHPL